MNAKDEGQQWREVWPTDSHEWFISEVTDGTSVFPVLQDYAEDLVNLLSALQQQVTELEEERDEAKHLLEQSLLELDARIEEQADYMEVVKKQQQALLVLKAWIKSSKEDAATVNYEGIAQIVNEAYEAAETLTSPSTIAQKEMVQ